MTDLSQASIVLLFRLCASILIAGVSVICFVLPGLLKEKSLRYFSFLHSFCTGIMFGMGFIVYVLQGVVVSSFSFQASILLSSCAFISIVAMEHLSTTSSYDYEPVSMISEGGEVDDDGVELLAIGETNFNAVEAGEKDEDADHHVMMPNIHSKNSKFYPSIVLMFASLYDFLGGIVIGYEEHYDFSALIQYILTKALMSVTFGTILESLSAPTSVFKWFAFVFTMSSPLGILLGAYIIPSIMSSAFVMPVVHNSIGFVSAVAAGVFLNIAAMNMIPAELYSMDSSVNGGADGHGGVSAQDTAKGRVNKLLKLSAFVVGYVLTIAPFYLAEYLV